MLQKCAVQCVPMKPVSTKGFIESLVSLNSISYIINNFDDMIRIENEVLCDELRGSFIPI